MCPIQGFSLSNNIVGYQFHLEIDNSRLQQAIKKWKLTAEGKTQHPQTILELSEFHMKTLQDKYFTLLTNWWL